MYEVHAPMSSLKINGSHRFASCWRIERRDGVVLRFTDHDTDLVVDGETYTPTGGFNAAARERVEGVDAGNSEIVGVLTSDAITHADLLAGKYRRATIREIVVDWRFPFAGKHDEHEYIIGETTFSRQTWVAQLEGLASRLRIRVGRTQSRRCDVQELGDARCGADLSDKIQVGVAVTAIDVDRKQFQTDALVSFPSGYYDDGKIEWTSLPGREGFEGAISGVKSWTTVNATLALQIRTPFAIEVGDEFTLTPGCDRQFSTCQTKFENHKRFRGVPRLPGNDALLRVPEPVE